MVDDKENVSSLQTAPNVWTENEFNDISMTSAIFLKSMTSPGPENAFANSITFHDSS